MPKLFIFDAFTLLIREKTVANYALLRCKTFSLKIWVCKIFDKFHVCPLDLFFRSLSIGPLSACLEVFQLVIVMPKLLSQKIKMALYCPQV